MGMRDLGTLGGTDYNGFGTATGINAAGQVVGSSGHTFMTGPDRTAKRPGNSEPYGINDVGQVVGRADTAGGAHAFITCPNGMGMRDLGTLGGDYSAGFGINHTGQVAGLFRTAGGSGDAFITGPNGVGMTDLGTLGGNFSRAEGINASGTGWWVSLTQREASPMLS